MRVRRWVLGGGATVIVLVALGALFVGAFARRSCTHVGCAAPWQAGVDVGALEPLRGEGRTAEFCVDEDCSESTWDNPIDSPHLVGDDNESRRTASTATFVIEEQGAELVSYRWDGTTEANAVRINGPGCEPLCRTMTFAIENEELRPVQNDPDRSSS